MTEIPEHLLKRSKARRSAMGLGGEGGDDAAPAEAASTAPAPVESAPVPASALPAAAAPPPPPPPPPPPYIQAANNRKRIPYWAMPVLVLLPVWAVLYLNAVKVPPAADDQLAVGAEVYAKCSSCHGAGGEGGAAGAQLSGGEVLKTWPDPKAMMEWIWLGANDWTGSSSAADYGDPDREGGPHSTGTLNGVMPAFKGQLSAEELAAVTRYIREDLSGAPDETEVITPELAQEAIDDADAGKLIYKGEAADDARVKASNP